MSRAIGVKMKVTRDLKAELVAFFKEMKDAYITKSEQKFDDFLKAKDTEFLAASMCITGNAYIHAKGDIAAMLERQIDIAESLEIIRDASASDA